jgi:hypothetical protein
MYNKRCRDVTTVYIGYSLLIARCGPASHWVVGLEASWVSTATAVPNDWYHRAGRSPVTVRLVGVRVSTARWRATLGRVAGKMYYVA